MKKYLIDKGFKKINNDPEEIVYDLKHFTVYFFPSSIDICISNDFGYYDIENISETTLRTLIEVFLKAPYITFTK